MGFPRTFSAFHAAYHAGYGESVWGFKSNTPAAGGAPFGTSFGLPISMFQWAGQNPGPGAAPGAARQPTKATAGAIPFTNPSGGRSKWLIHMLAIQASSRAVGGGVTYGLVDRLADNSGLSGTAAGAQTTNLPITAARYTGTAAAGNRIALEIWSGIGTTTRTASVTYTNQAGTGSRVSPSFNISSLASWPRSTYSWVPIPLAAGDTGVRSVESFTLSGSTGTVGNIGVVIYRPLAMLYSNSSSCGGCGYESSLYTPVGPVEIKTDACLHWWQVQPGTLPAQLEFNLQMVEN